MNKKSFTLIELLVVIAIIGILSSLVIARFSDWGDNARIANTLQWSAGVHRTLGANLVGHWPLDDGSGTIARDLSGYGRNGTLTGNPEWRIGEAPSGEGSSLYFNGTSANYVETGFNWNYLQNMTTILWFRIVSEDWEILSIGPFGSYRSTPNSAGRMFYRNSHDVSNLMRWWLGYTTTTDSILSATRDFTNFELNKWYQVVATIKEEGGRSFYIDGVLVYETNTPPNNFKNWNSAIPGTDSDQNLNLGKGLGTGQTGYLMRGNVDDIRIYDTVLTAEEVSRIYAETKDSYLAYE